MVLSMAVDHWRGLDIILVVRVGTHLLGTTHWCARMLVSGMPRFLFVSLVRNLCLSLVRKLTLLERRRDFNEN